MRFPYYLSEQDDAWRFVLGTRGQRPLFTVGLNPHKAIQTDPDRTVAKVEQLALSSGHDSFVMLNLYPVRSRTVAALPSSADPSALLKNKQAILDILAKHSPPHVWLAWGADMEKREYLREMAIHLITQAQALNPAWYSLGPLTKHGHPRHPSRAANSWQLQSFDAAAYVELLRGGMICKNCNPTR